MNRTENALLGVVCWATVKGLQLSEILQLSGEVLSSFGRRLEAGIRGHVMDAIAQQQADGEKNKP